METDWGRVNPEGVSNATPRMSTAVKMEEAEEEEEDRVYFRVNFMNDFNFPGKLAS